VTGLPRAFALRGAEAAQALDWLHAHADLQGVLEGEDVITVWLAGPLPVPPFGAVVVTEVEVRPEDANITGLENDTAIVVATDLLVRPPWVERAADFHGIELVVPRGGAFGSGEHASTRAALRCLHANWDAPASFADIGTGSGILALYAQVRGCRRIEACDIDAASVQAARELLPMAKVHLGGAATVGMVDGMVANMTASELTAAMPDLLSRWTRRRSLVLSGLRAAEVDAVAALVGRPVAVRETVEPFTALVYRGDDAAR
jgi:ribosomal protein L11 methylase PrmA